MKELWLHESLKGNHLPIEKTSISLGLEIMYFKEIPEEEKEKVISLKRIGRAWKKGNDCLI